MISGSTDVATLLRLTEARSGARVPTRSDIALSQPEKSSENPVLIIPTSPLA
jgi:hypothetical protein